MKKALLIALALVALFAFVSCSEVTPVGTYKASENVTDNVKITAKLTLKSDGTVVLADVSAKATSDTTLAQTAASTIDAAVSICAGEVGKWEHDGSTVTINGVDAAYNGTSLKYKVGSYTLTFKR